MFFNFEFFLATRWRWRAKITTFQNRKLHQTVVTVCFRKKTPLTLCFNSTNIINIFFSFLFHYIYRIKKKFSTKPCFRVSVIPAVHDLISFWKVSIFILWAFWLGQIKLKNDEILNKPSCHRVVANDKRQDHLVAGDMGQVVPNFIELHRFVLKRILF